METILVCDDDQEIVQAIAIYLENEGYEVQCAYNGAEALECLQKRSDIALVILDVMMPDVDGIETTRRIREENNIPIIMLSAKSEDQDKIVGLRTGADDYVTKPFNPEELIARVQSQLRRSGMMQMDRGGAVYQVGGLQMSDEDTSVMVDGRNVRLTPLEYNILKLLVRKPGKVFSTAEIYETIWKEKAIGAENVVAVHVRHIREKIEINPREPQYLKVVWGVGYKIERQETMPEDTIS